VLERLYTDQDRERLRTERHNVPSRPGPQTRRGR
jgi:hypothetical protein